MLPYTPGIIDLEQFGGLMRLSCGAEPFLCCRECSVGKGYWAIMQKERSITPHSPLGVLHLEIDWSTTDKVIVSALRNREL